MINREITQTKDDVAMRNVTDFPYDPPTLADYEARPPHPQRIGGGPRFVNGEVVPPKKQPLISIITPSLNAVKTIEATFKSVIGQKVPGELEYIVVDAASKDGTIDLVRKYEKHLALWISEPDEGISDGFNKGVAPGNRQVHPSCVCRRHLGRKSPGDRDRAP